ncbi:ClpP class periplasmic serine protease [Candidatus Methanoperedens nitroreducens]|uniref:ClpP class periplasmic serine protease n=1 Tax=Candidatus Methanoperedens nitratireducens TaxID=1392998 RepID=A0A062VAE1_9EURY|nr:ATP-dependent Clp protease proteolytic subunit [Candidatus Methanoperedens nitroreducens]KCZ73438.1 ClpP class periplasmic serine protease [Candidatus Methanoperedens nitroreducens]MDJ1422606.1 ATP-dependent Clp protease proteolytic subunit [Candidatus Methanoperedens sp.]
MNIAIGDILNFIWILFLLMLFVPLLQKRLMAGRRISIIQSMEKDRQSRVITMIHRQETMSLLGIPIARYIDIEDSEAVLRAIRMTPPEMPIDLVLHTPGGLVLASEQIACALKRHTGKVTVFVPHYAMSGGTLVAMAADEIVMDPNAVLGPVDPQLGGQQGYYPAASILKALEHPNPNRDDQILILGDVARKAINQVHKTVYNLLLEHHEPEKANEIAKMLSEGQWTHDYPIDFDQAREMGLPMNDQVPNEIYALMELYPQSGQRRPSVEFIPTPYRPSAPAPRKRA